MQFTYGDDGLHPDKMESNDRPVDFERLRMYAREVAPCHDEKALRGGDLNKLVDKKLNEEGFQALLPTGKVFHQETRDYFANLASQIEALAEELGSADYLNQLSWNHCRVTTSQVNMIMNIALDRCLRAHVEPGEAIGAIGAQSISEPGTQMTLKVSLCNPCGLSSRPF